MDFIVGVDWGRKDGMMTCSIIYNGTEEQQQAIARMRGAGILVTVWDAPPGYKLPEPIPFEEDDDSPSGSEHQER